MTASHPERRARKWHVGEKAVIDHLVRSMSGTPAAAPRRVLSATTETGLCIEDQLRKAHNPPAKGLAIF